MDALASALLEPLVDRLMTAAAEKFRLFRDGPEELEKLRSKLSIIRCVLKDAEKRSVEAPVGEWLRQLKQVFLDADDLLDEYATDAALQSTQILEINKKLDDLASWKDKLGLQVSVPEENSRLEPMRRQPTSSLLADEHSVIGRSSEREVIVKLLLPSDPVAVSNKRRSLSVLPIVGMGGMGKTTLAKLVFNDKKVVEHFDLRIWVCASSDFDLIRLTKDMIDGANVYKGKNEQCAITQWDLMQQKLSGELEGKTFLLVLDDVWEANLSQWETLFEPLKFASRASKIMITTRNMDVVDKIQGRVDPIRLGRLSEADIWSLFKGYAFHGVTNADGIINAAHSHLESTGRHIVGRLKGSPLAARTIGSLLGGKLAREYWEEILNSEMWTLDLEPDGILPTLGLSYQHLPGNLKQCFAYFSLFPKDHKFEQQELVKLWNAQSFIRMETGKSMETSGSKYLNNLLQRSFLDPSPTPLGLPRRCVLHDLMHDLAECVSKDDCLRLEDHKCTEIPVTVRHISLFVEELDQQRLKELCKHEKLRTLLFLTRHKFNGSTNLDLDELFQKLKRLRVLGLKNCGISKLPDSIGGMKHLRYIDLSGNPDLKKLPSTMSKLINLRHLQALDSLVSTIDGLEKLTALLELDVEGGKVKELGGMGMLRKLTISRMENVGSEDAMKARLESKEHLQELTLVWTNASNPLRIDEETAFQALRPADTITDLSIYGYHGTKWWVSDNDAAVRPPVVFSRLRSLKMMSCPKLSELSSLPPTLTSLRLIDMNLTSLPELRGCNHRHDAGGDGGETSSSCSCSASAALSELYISQCPKLTSLSGLLRHHLTVLKELTIDNCRKLVSLPERGFGHLVSLKELVISDCDKLTCPSLQDAPVPLPLPRTLQKLRIDGCGDAMGGWWWAGLQHLTSLANLTLGGCPNTVASFFEADPLQPPPTHQPEGTTDPGWKKKKKTGEDPLSLGRHHNHHLAATLTNLKILDCPFDYQQASSSPSTSSSSRPAAEDATMVGFRALTSLTHLELHRSRGVLQKWGLGGLPSSLQFLTVRGDDDLNDEFLQSIIGARDLQSLPNSDLQSLRRWRLDARLAQNPPHS